MNYLEWSIGLSWHEKKMQIILQLQIKYPVSKYNSLLWERCSSAIPVSQSKKDYQNWWKAERKCYSPVIKQKEKSCFVF